MIEFRFNQDKEIFLEYAAELGDHDVAAIIGRGVIGSPAEATALARFYWKMVDASVGDPIRDTLERIHNALFDAFDEAGYEEIWDEEVSRA